MTRRGEDAQFLSHLPKYMIAYDQHSWFGVYYILDASNVVRLRYFRPHYHTCIIVAPCVLVDHYLSQYRGQVSLTYGFIKDLEFL